MNELLQKHGCANVFSIPEGLKELMSDISREVLREQPTKIYDFIANYLSVLLITREHGILAVRVLDDLCDCRPSVAEHLAEIGLTGEQAITIADVIKEEVESVEPTEGKETVKETQIIKRILTKVVLDEVKTAKVCQVARNAYREYWYRKKLLEQRLKEAPDEPWQIAAERTLQIYKSTKPTFAELTRAAEKIQAAYRGYHVRRNLLSHLKPKKKKRGPKVDLPGPPLDIAASREIDLGPLINLKVREDDVKIMFDEHATQKLGLPYDPQKAITHVEDMEFDENVPPEERSRAPSRVADLKSAKSLVQPSQMLDENVPPEERSRAVSRVANLKSAKSLVQPSQMIDENVPPEERSRAASRAADLKSAKSLVHPSQMPMSQGGMVAPNADDESEAPPRRSRLASHVPEPLPRQSRLISQVSETGARQIRLPSQVQSAHLSFSEVPPEVIPEESHELKEEIHVAAKGEEGAVQEIPEDIPDDRTEGDGESAPTASVPTSAAETDASEVEDIAEDMTTSGEEEG